ncbi:MAG: DNA polymerase I [Lachnospiraceae bacterium]|nr:DNA polymerase I [Lachnospiraceae bacterium]
MSDIQEQKLLVLIDGSSLLSTQYYGNLPIEVLTAKTEEEKQQYYGKIMHSPKGVYTNAIYGFMRALLKICREQKPTHIAVAWDVTRDTFRRELYPDYKANRLETAAPLKEQFVLCQEILGKIGVRQFMSPTYEADDYCGTLSKQFENEIPVRILTKDHDYLQLVSDRTNLWMIYSSIAKADELYKKYGISKDGSVPEKCFELTPRLVKSEFGVEPASIADLKGLQGDSSDNIKGVPGVGPATAVALIAHYKTVEALYGAMEGLDEAGLKNLAASWKDIGISRSPIAKLIKEDDNELTGRKAAFLSKQLATIKRDIDLEGLCLDDLSLNIDTNELQTIFDELDIKSIKADIGTETAKPSSVEYKFLEGITEVEELIGKILDNRGMTPDVAEVSETLAGAAVLFDRKDPVALALSFEDDNYIIESGGFITGAYLGDLLVRLDNQGVNISFFDIKSIVKTFDITGFINAFDISVAAYLLDPLSQNYDCVSVSRKYLERFGTGIAEITGKGNPTQRWNEDRDRLAAALAFESASAKDVYPIMRRQLQEGGMTDLYYHIELPLVYTLSGMEKAGIMVEKEQLKDFGMSLKSDIDRLEKEIWQAAGEEFNINSPKQLGTILFDKLRLPGGKKTKSGYSTSADVLEKIKLEDPIIEKILEYRQLTKLNSTYAEGLYDYIDEDGRIRTTFNQTVTATGRLSSTDPNLQNIPIRTSLGREIRKVFVASPGCVFIDADYSQIELRILAAMSGDEKLIAAYRNSEDIHRATAAAVFHVPPEEVTPQLRSRAKAVNFGIVYGISSFGLGEDLKISKKEAEKYISDYFETYPKIKKFLDDLVSSAREKGWAVTGFGRRRPIPELASSNFMQRQFGERVAMNTPVQGTAADIIKTAMIRVDARLRSECPSAKLLLQVHDELLVEARIEDKELVKNILVEEMQGAADLPVKLEVSVESGRNWFEAH